MAVTFPCTNCGGNLEFQPGTRSLECPFCGSANRIERAEERVEELDFRSFLKKAESSEATEERLTVDCESCGGRTCLGENVTASECDFCGTKLVAQSRSIKAIRPRSLLPFKVAGERALAAFREWLAGLWFAPNALKKYARAHGIKGVYCPYWTYDCRTQTHYSGQRGEHYYTTESYTTTENGRTVTKTRQVRRTRWYPASGTVHDVFDDVLVLGTTSLPQKYAEELEPWDLKNLVSYDERYLSGFTVQSYNVELRQGFDEAQEKMEPTIRETVRRDIGGDEQRVHSMDVGYSDITFKHLLLPVWISAYRFKEKVYRFLVNARTGEVQGERPWSWVKITLAALAGLALIAAIVYFVNQP